MKTKPIIYLVLILLLLSCTNQAIKVKNYGSSSSKNKEKVSSITLSNFDNYESVLYKIRTLPCQDSIPKITMDDEKTTRNIYPITQCEPPLFHPKKKHYISIDNDKIYLNHYKNELNLDSLNYYFENNFTDYHEVNGKNTLTHYLVIIEARENIKLDRIEKFFIQLTRAYDELETDLQLSILLTKPAKRIIPGRMNQLDENIYE